MLIIKSPSNTPFFWLYTYFSPIQKNLRKKLKDIIFKNYKIPLKETSINLYSKVGNLIYIMLLNLLLIQMKTTKKKIVAIFLKTFVNFILFLNIIFLFALVWWKKIHNFFQYKARVIKKNETLLQLAIS